MRASRSDHGLQPCIKIGANQVQRGQKSPKRQPKCLSTCPPFTVALVGSLRHNFGDAVLEVEDRRFGLATAFVVTAIDPQLGIFRFCTIPSVLGLVRQWEQRNGSALRPADKNAPGTQASELSSPGSSSLKNRPSESRPWARRSRGS